MHAYILVIHYFSKPLRNVLVLLKTYYFFSEGGFAPLALPPPKHVTAFFFVFAKLRTVAAELRTSHGRLTSVFIDREHYVERLEIDLP